jgi:hypothetical protein
MRENTTNITGPVDDPVIGEALRDAARGISEIRDFTAQKELDALSSKTSFTGIDVYEDAIFRDKNGYSAPVTIYVELNYAEKAGKSVIGDSFPGRVTFYIEDKKVKILDITADTSSFAS